MENKPSITQRIENVLNDVKFKKHCVMLRSLNPHFSQDFEMCEKIANININNIQIDGSKININAFSPEQVKQNIVEFYAYLDQLCPEQPLLNKVEENFKYLKLEHDKQHFCRSYCSTRIDDEGKEIREIFCNVEGRVGDNSTAVHEVCHSLSKSFEILKRPKDQRMTEVCPVIMDAISSYYFSKKYPQLNENFNEDALNAQVVNVIKARESLLDAVVIDVMTGHLTQSKAVMRYGEMFSRNTNILNRCLNNIEQYKFSAMFEKKYLVPQAIALEMLDRFKQNPSLTISQFKTVLSHDHEWTLEETLNYLGLEQQQTLIDSYVNKFGARTNELKSKQNRQSKQ